MRPHFGGRIESNGNTVSKAYDTDIYGTTQQKPHAICLSLAKTNVNSQPQVPPH
jgi:hypothetical protein